MEKITKLFLLFTVFYTTQVAYGAKNVVLLIGDGMGVTHITAARIYAMKASGELELDKMPYTAKIKTYSYDDIVTDSAAGATAFATGQKVKNAVLSMSRHTVPGKRDGGKLQTVLELAKANGKSVGLVTTTRITHATPAAFCAHINHRDLEDDIARQFVDAPIDVALGGGLKHFTAEGRADQQDLRPMFVEKGYTVVEDRYQLRKLKVTPNTKLLGLFNTSHLTYMVDRKKKNFKEPTLPEMAHAAIEILSQNEKGYFVMIEGGRIDHAAHDNLAKHSFEELIAFDKTVSAVLSQVDLKDTLVLVTSDHATGGLTLNGYGSHHQSIFSESVEKGLKGDVIPLLSWATGPGALTNHAPKNLTRRFEEWQPTHFAAQWSHHTGEDVMLYAKGVGAENVHGTWENTAVYDFMKKEFGF